jgi:hypothetical protein
MRASALRQIGKWHLLCLQILHSLEHFGPVELIESGIQSLDKVQLVITILTDQQLTDSF